MKPINRFSKKDISEIMSSISEAEKNTSGEIRVHFDDFCPTNIIDKAIEVFHLLKMEKTKQKNGVLVYVAIDDKKLAIIGDIGINSKVGSSFWEDVKNIMIKHFKDDKIKEGVCKAVESIGMKLKDLFPYQKDDVNELPNDISFKSTLNEDNK